MHTFNPNSPLVLAKKRQLIHGWFKFFCVLALVFYSLTYFVVSIYWFASAPPDFITINVERTPSYFLIMSLFFVPVIASVYGLLQGKNWGLLGCLILSYLGLAHHLYCLLTTGNIILGLIITLVMLVQLHKIKAAWAQLLETEVSEMTTTTVS